MTGIRKRVYEELVELKKRDQLDLTTSYTSRKSFSTNFEWSKSVLTVHEKEIVEEVLVDSHKIVAPYRVDIGSNY